MTGLGTRQAADPSGPPELDMAGMVAALKAAGYNVSKRRAQAEPSTAGRKRATRSGKGHGQCAEHWRIDGMSKPVCVLDARTVDGVELPGQDREDVLRFAEDIVRIAASAGDVLIAARRRDATRIAAEKAARKEQRQRAMRGEEVAA